MSDFFASHPDPVVRYREDDRPTVAAVNPAFAQQFSVDVDDLVGESVETALAAVGIDADVDELESEVEEAVPDSDEDDPDADGGDAEDGAGHPDTGAASTGLTAEVGVTAVVGRHYALRQVDTDDGGYLLVTDAWASVDAESARLSMDDDLGTVTADRERLRTLFENLFRNSIEHAGADVAISVDATDMGFVVADDGPGIPPDRRDAVFEAGVSTGSGTTGLGLSIVSEIAAAHGWTVSLTDSPDGGAQFEFARSSA